MTVPETNDNQSNSYAAIDLGSNSFHMVMATLEGGSIRIIDSLRLPVRLGAGLDDHKNLTPATEKAALEALAQFAQRLQGVPRRQIRVVGTNTLRRARNAERFINEAFTILRKRIEIISGREEARLIFAAVSHGLPAPGRKRLVVDIGGGSTEIITGADFTPHLMESMNMGCVSYTVQYFHNEHITAAAMKTSIVHAQLELQPLRKAYLAYPWEEVIGCSGTIKAVSGVLQELELTDGTITLGALRKLQKYLTQAGRVERVRLDSVGKDRLQVLPAGLSILHAIMQTLDIESMQASQVALREGLIFELIGKSEHQDIQAQTISNLRDRYHVDDAQAARVSELAARLFELAAVPWELDDEIDRNLLLWAAGVHEIGLSVAHTQYHKHGAYLIENSDLLGFSRAEQNALALLVRFHRRKLDTAAFDALPGSERDRLVRLLILLRLAVLLYRSRYAENLTPVQVRFESNRVTIEATRKWFSAHPLTTADLNEEARLLTPTGTSLVINQ